MNDNELMYLLHHMDRNQGQSSREIVRVKSFSKEKNDSIEMPSLPSSNSFSPSILSEPWNKYIPILKILVIFSCPSNTNSLRLQGEEKIIREALCDSVGYPLHSHDNSSNISIKFLPACTIDDLRTNLLLDEYHVIHFSGHADRIILLTNHIYDMILSTYKSIEKSDIYGNNDLKHIINQISELVIKEYECQLSDISKQICLDISIPIHLEYDYKSSKCIETTHISYSHIYTYSELIHLGIGSLAFESNTGHALFVPPTAFANLLSQHKSLQCIIINACSSNIQGHAMLPHVPLVISHQGQISDQESIAFSQGFYYSLRFGNISFENSYKHGVSNVELKRMMPGMPKRSNILSYEEIIVLRKNEMLCKERFHQLLSMQSNSGSSNYSNNSNLDNIEKMDGDRMKQLNDLSDWNDVTDLNNSNDLNDERVNSVEKSVLEIENVKLRSLVAYGLQLLQAKDKELDTIKAMMRILINDCTNPDTIRLAEILLSQSNGQSNTANTSSPSNTFSVGIESAIGVMSSLLQSNNSMVPITKPLQKNNRVSASTVIIDKSSRGKNINTNGSNSNSNSRNTTITTTTNNNNNSNNNNSRLDSNRINSNRKLNTMNRISSLDINSNRKKAYIATNRVINENAARRSMASSKTKSKQSSGQVISSATIACLKKPTKDNSNNNAIKIVFGYREQEVNATISHTNVDSKKSIPKIEKKLIVVDMETSKESDKIVEESVVLFEHSKDHNISKDMEKNIVDKNVLDKNVSKLSLFRLSPQRKTSSSVPTSPRNSSSSNNNLSSSNSLISIDNNKSNQSSVISNNPVSEFNTQPIVSVEVNANKMIENIFFDQNNTEEQTPMTVKDMSSLISSPISSPENYPPSNRLKSTNTSPEKGKLISVYQQTNAASKAFRNFLKEKRTSVSPSAK